MKYCAITDIGLKRSTNQDGIFIDGHLACDDKYFLMCGNTDKKEYIAAVFDGVGGTEQGELAVRYGVNFLLHSNVPTNVREISKLIKDLNSEVFNAYNQKKIVTASTIAGIVYCTAGVFAFNVGDSSVFIINNGYLEQVSFDDTVSSYINSFCDSMEPEVDTQNFSKSPLTQYIGKAEEEIEVHITEIKGSKEVLICTDGLTDLIDIDDIEQIISRNTGDYTAIAHILHECALENGGTDNITLILVNLD